MKQIRSNVDEILQIRFLSWNWTKLRRFFHAAKVMNIEKSGLMYSLNNPAKRCFYSQKLASIQPGMISERSRNRQRSKSPDGGSVSGIPGRSSAGRRRSSARFLYALHARQVREDRWRSTAVLRRQSCTLHFTWNNAGWWGPARWKLNWKLNRKFSRK